MRLDLYPGSGLTLSDAAATARGAEAAGFAGLWALEAAVEPFSPLAIAAEHSTRLELRTGVAVAFARNPMVTAHLAHELARCSGGRFVLGLGSQVRAHIERRFGEPWSDPVGRMAEYLAALRAIWASWNEGRPLEFRGRHYSHTLMTPMFDPGPSGCPPPAVHVAAVGPAMTAMAAEHADGVVLHPLSSVRTVENQVLRRLGERACELSCPVLVITGETETELSRARAAVRKQIAFYASTPAYRRVLDQYGEADRADRLRALARDGRWDDMAGLITGELLREFAVEAPVDRLAREVEARWAGILDRAALYAPYPVSARTWRAIAGGDS